MKILWLASWYPSEIAPFNGDFVKRHAEAASLYNEIQVIFVIRDSKGNKTRKTLVESTVIENLKETVIYYFVRPTPFILLDKLISAAKYRKLYKRAVKKSFADAGKADLVHLHVALAAGGIAKWIKKKYNIDYVLSEHWTGFLPEAANEYKRLPLHLKLMSRSVIRHAKGISTVSNHLAAQLKKISSCQNFVVIPNVVNTTIFRYAPLREKETTRFLHISTLGYQKNPEDILKAFALVSARKLDFEVDFVGPESDSLVQLAGELGLGDRIRFRGEVRQADLVPYLHRSSALILYSRYETFGCVIIEANACGRPVIVSDIPTLHETVEGGVNGIFSKGESPEMLAAAIADLIAGKYVFDPTLLSESASNKYSYRTVGAQFDEWYRRFI